MGQQNLYFADCFVKRNNSQGTWYRYWDHNKKMNNFQNFYMNGIMNGMNMKGMNINQMNMNQNMNPMNQNMNPMAQNNMNFQNMNVFKNMMVPFMLMMNNNMMNNNMMNNNMMNNNMMNNNMNNINNNMNNNINNSIKEQAPQPLLARGDRTLQFKNEFPYVNEESLRNINFVASSGLKVVIIVPDYITFKELFKLYVKKIGVSDRLLGKELIFIFNALTIEPNDERKISELFTKSFQQMAITVVDSNNVLGAS